MSNEGVAEEIYEAGLELVNPGGRPDVLRHAAKGWREMGKHLDSTFRQLNTEVANTLGDHWRGDSADAFREHWSQLKKAVEETLPVFDQAAEGLDKAADSIEKINDEIHQIYLEIGISIGVSVGLSFITMGFSAAAGAAEAAELAAQAAQAATRLGRILSAVAKAFRAIRTFTQGTKFVNVAAKWGLKLGGEYAVGTGSGMATSLLSGKGFEVKDNLVNGAAGMAGGGLAGKLVDGRLASRIGERAEAGISGALGGAFGSGIGDTANSLRKGDEFDASQMAIGAVTGAGGGAASGVATHRAVDGEGLTGGRAWATEQDIGAGVGMLTGVPGNAIKDLDGAIFGDPNADGGPEAGSVAEADKKNRERAGRLREKPDPGKFGAFG